MISYAELDYCSYSVNNLSPFYFRFLCLDYVFKE